MSYRPFTRSISRLLVAIAGAAVLGMGSIASAQYNAEINRWKQQDLLDPVPEGSLLFVGSSTIRRWETLTRDFADYNAVQRGLGGALMSELLAQENDWVLRLKPRAVVVWAGTNDLASGSNGATVAANFATFANNLLAVQPDVDIFYIGIMPTPGRAGNRFQEDIANGNIKNFAASNAKVHYIDMPAAFQTLNPYAGSQFTNKFVDSIHLNRSGYEYFSSVVRSQIESVVAPNKTFVANPNTLARGERLLFDFGPSDGTNGDVTLVDSNGNHWNNWFSVGGGAVILPGEHRANLVSSTGRNTGIRMTITAQFIANGKQNGGLLNPDPAKLGDFGIPSVTSDYFYSTGNNINDGTDDDTAGGFMIDGLDPELTYDFRIFASRDSTQTRITEYMLIGANTVTTTLRTSGNNIGSDGIYDGNDSTIALLQGVRPDEFGRIWFDQTLLQGDFAYISAMEITAVPEPATATAAAAAAGALLLRRRR